MVGVDAEHLRPALSTSVLEVDVDVLKSLINLRVDFLVEYACLRIPAT